MCFHRLGSLDARGLAGLGEKNVKPRCLSISYITAPMARGGRAATINMDMANMLHANSDMSSILMSGLLSLVMVRMKFTPERVEEMPPMIIAISIRSMPSECKDRVENGGYKV
jgi:hypothetical protein